MLCFESVIVYVNKCDVFDLFTLVAPPDPRGTFPQGVLSVYTVATCRCISVGEIWVAEKMGKKWLQTIIVHMQAEFSVRGKGVAELYLYSSSGHFVACYMVTFNTFHHILNEEALFLSAFILGGGDMRIQMDSLHCFLRKSY
jgi:hypothetical protein